jgi:hypothetical protein
MPIGVCKLCLQTKDLQDSHYLPKGAYKVNRAPALNNPHPVVLSNDELLQSSAQLSDYLLCSDCEQRFSKNGEAWVLGNVPRNYGEKFPILDGLSAEVPLLTDGGTKVYAGAKSKLLDMEKIVYFAMSVFWRGAVHNWKSTLRSEAPDVHLCAYEEPIRQFLLGTSSLHDDVALTVYVCPNGSVLNALLVPWEAHLPECSRYLFYISGLGFTLHFVDKLPQHFRKTCAYHSPDKVIALSTEFENLIREILRDQVKNRDNSRVKKMLQEIAKVRSYPLRGTR